jgi:hypothetical protein
MRTFCRISYAQLGWWYACLLSEWDFMASEPVIALAGFISS